MTEFDPLLIQKVRGEREFKNIFFHALSLELAERKYPQSEQTTAKLMRGVLGQDVNFSRADLKIEELFKDFCRAIRELGDLNEIKKLCDREHVEWPKQDVMEMLERTALELYFEDSNRAGNKQ